jgi:hypothetical protein
VHSAVPSCLIPRFFSCSRSVLALHLAAAPLGAPAASVAALRTPEKGCAIALHQRELLKTKESTTS